jgi:ferredoxin
MESEITFLPKNKKTSIPIGTTILDASLGIGLTHRHVCGGNATCGTCRVIVLEGKENLSPISRRELELLGEDRIQQNCRLACQSKILGKVVVKIPSWLPAAVQKF